MRQYKWRHQYEEVAKPPGPVNISERQVHRVQLLSTFLDLYLPKRYDKSLTSSFDYIAELPQIDLASPLLQTSIDTLCLAELGSLYEDERCLRESQARYVRALPMLANELARPPSRRMRSDHILAAIAVLTMCELFDAIAQGNGTGRGWISHVNGAQQYIKAMGPDKINSHFGWLLFHNVRHSSMCMGFVKRQGVFFAEPKWLKLTAEHAKHNQFVALYDITLQIPGVLERVDNLKVSEDFQQDHGSVCAEMCRLRNELEDWLHKFYTDRSIQCYKIVDVRDMKEFARLCLDRTFQTVFSFQSTQSCSQQQLFWTSCLILDFTLLSMHRRMFDSSRDPRIRLKALTSRSEADIERDMFVAATSYCRSLPFCCEPETASVGRIGTFLLRLVQNYFEQSGHCRELEWCTAVREMLQSYPEPPTNVKDNNGDVPGAPWNAKHRCDSPICNFRVECVAPAPLLLAGEYPSNGYTPRHDSREVSFDSKESPTSKDDSKTSAKTHDVMRFSIPAARDRRFKANRITLPVGISKANGTSALADEKVLTQEFMPIIAV